MTHDPTNSPEASDPPAQGKEQDYTRDQDVRERPVREQLKNTSITPSDRLDPNSHTQPAAEDVSSEAGSINTDPEQVPKEADPSAPSLRGRRKRSYDEINPENVDDSPDVANSKHFRKRSRDNRTITTEEDNNNHDEDNEADDDDDDDDDYSDREPAPRATIRETTENKDSNTLHPEAQLDSKPGSAIERTTTPPANRTSSTSPKLEDTTSPQNKRNRDQFMIDHDQGAASAKPKHQPESTSTDPPTSHDAVATESSSAFSTTKSVQDEPNTKRPRDESLPSTKPFEPTTSPKLTFAESGFANTSTESPFGTLAGSKSPPPSSLTRTSSSAFASSGFASFADSTQSPFGVVAPSSKTATTDTQSSVEEASKDSAPTSGFAALSSKTQSPFASAGASPFASQPGFGTLSNGFGSFGDGSSGFGAPLSSFAKPGASGIIGLGSKPAKPFGAASDPDDAEEGDNHEEETESADAVISPKADSPTDPRFYEQELETGEENEETLFTSRAKLYVAMQKQWKERGVGTFKVNASTAKDSESNGESLSKRTARFIMRADGSHRIVLNSPIKKEIILTDNEGQAPKGKNVLFLGFIDGEPTMMQLKMRSSTLVEELYDVVIGLQKEL